MAAELTTGFQAPCNYCSHRGRCEKCRETGIRQERNGKFEENRNKYHSKLCVSYSLLKTSHDSFIESSKVALLVTGIFMLLMKKMKHREVKSLDQNHTAS